MRQRKKQIKNVETKERPTDFQDGKMEKTIRKIIGEHDTLLNTV